MQLKKVIILGPESTGKSTLCARLATHYSTLWCPEYAREYLLKNGNDYSYQDLLIIAKGQLELEEEFVKKMLEKVAHETAVENLETAILKPETEIENDQSPTTNHKPKTRNPKQETCIRQPSTVNCQLLFADTDMHVMKVWCEYVFNKCHSFILEKLAEQSCDLYLLCNPDLPWVKDELREYPDLQSRLELYHIYKDLLINQQIPWIIINGSDYENRFLQAVEAVEKYIIS